MSMRNNEPALVVGQKSYHPIVEHVVMHSFDIRLPSDVMFDQQLEPTRYSLWTSTNFLFTAVA